MEFREAMRLMAVTLLQGNTLAGYQVESGRAVDVTTDDMPFLGIYTGNEIKLARTEGTVLIFDATFTLHVDVRVANPDLPACEMDLDRLIGEVQNTLLRNVVFYMVQPNGSRLVRNVRKVEVQSIVKQDAEVNIGMAMVSIDLEYNDAYPIDVTGTLATISASIAPNAPPPAPPAPATPATVTITLATPGVPLPPR